MKKINFLICFLTTSISFTQQQGVKKIEFVKEEIVLNWVANYEEVLKISRIENKPILIYFTGSDWCGPCIVLDEKLFHTKQFQSYSDKNLILYKADFPKKIEIIDLKTKEVNLRLRKKYKQKAFPTVLMINPDEKSLGVKKGRYNAKDYYTFFNAVVKKYQEKGVK